MATVLSVGDIAIVQYNSSTTDSFTFVFLRDVEAGTSVSFTDNGWLAAGGFRAGEGTVTYTAAAAITAGTIVTLTGLNLDDAGDQIIAYQGDPATPTILHLVDLADGNNTVAGDATSDNTTALPPGFTLDLNAVAVGFDNAIYAGPNRGSAVELSAAVSNSANWINSNSLATLFQVLERPVIDLDADNSTTGGRDYRAFVTSGGTAVKIADSDIDISDLDGTVIFDAEIHIRQAALGDVLSVNGALPAGIAASLYDPLTGVLTLTGGASHDAYEAAIRQIEFSTIQPIGTQKRIDVILFDGHDWSPEAKAFITVGSTVEITAAPVLDLDFNDSNGVVGADYTATFTSGGPEIPVADIDVSITDDDSAAIESAHHVGNLRRAPGCALLHRPGCVPSPRPTIRQPAFSRSPARLPWQNTRQPCAKWSSTPRALPLLTASFRSPSTTVTSTAMSARPSCTSLPTSRRRSISTRTARRPTAWTI